MNGMHWCWKQNGGGGWSLHQTSDGQHFTLRMERLRAASRIHPRVVAGELLGYNQTDDGFWMRARCNGFCRPNSCRWPRISRWTASIWMA